MQWNKIKYILVFSDSSYQNEQNDMIQRFPLQFSDTHIYVLERKIYFTRSNYGIFDIIFTLVFSTK